MIGNRPAHRASQPGPTHTRRLVAVFALSAAIVGCRSSSGRLAQEASHLCNKAGAAVEIASERWNQDKDDRALGLSGAQSLIVTLEVFQFCREIRKIPEARDEEMRKGSGEAVARLLDARDAGNRSLVGTELRRLAEYFAELRQYELED